MFDSQFLLILVLCLSAFYICYLFYVQSGEKEFLDKRIRHTLEKSYVNEGQTEYVQKRNLKGFSKLKAELQERFDQFSKNYIENNKLKFEQAGWTPQHAVRYSMISSMVFFCLGTSGFFMLMTSSEKVQKMQTSLKVAFFILIVLVSVRALEFILDIIIKQRQQRIRQSISFVIDLLGICTRSGLALDRSFEKIAEEIASHNPDVCREFTQISLELNMIPDRQVPLRNFMKRVDIPIIHMLATSLIQAEEQGVSISQTLKILSTEFNKQKMLEIEAKAARLPVLLTLPLMLFFLPSILIILIGPAIVQIVRSNSFIGG